VLLNFLLLNPLVWKQGKKQNGVQRSDLLIFGKDNHSLLRKKCVLFRIQWS